MRTDSEGRRVEVERFDSLRPDGLVEIDAPPADVGGVPGGQARHEGSGAESGPRAHQLALDVIVERDDRLAGPGVAKLERYEHFLTGWSAHTQRYGGRMRAAPLVVFICRDHVRARACARGADAVLSACRAYPGEYPFDWDYRAREQIVFVAERDMHESHTLAYGVPALPPAVRVAAAGGDPRAGETTVERRQILPARHGGEQ
jgi:hypothetical protein